MGVTFLGGYLIKSAPESYHYMFIIFAVFGLYTAYGFSTIVPQKEEIKKKSFSLTESFSLLIRDLNFTKFMSLSIFTRHCQLNRHLYLTNIRKR